jgi:GTP cyclohydrolase I
VLIEWAGDDPSREGLIDTPGRVARSYRELFAGYAAEPRDYLKRTFEEVGGYDELVVLRDIRVVSFCEHHMLPFIGHAHVAYIPRGKVIGLSKIPRIVDMFASRLQVQERMTRQIVRQPLAPFDQVTRREPVETHANELLNLLPVPRIPMGAHNVWIGGVIRVPSGPQE